jgi:hypothetical protein
MAVFAATTSPIDCCQHLRRAHLCSAVAPVVAPFGAPGVAPDVAPAVAPDVAPAVAPVVGWLISEPL